MTRSSHRNRKQKARALNTLQEKGFTACVLGVGMLLIPMFVGKSPVIAGLAMALRPAGWAALALGVVLLGLHHFAKKHPAKSEGPRDGSQSSSAPSTRRHRKAPTTATEPKEPHWGGAAPSPAILATQSLAASDGRSVPAPATSCWSAEVFSAIEWRRFEAVCEALFAQAGFETRSQSHGADGGVDIWLHSRNNADATPVAVVQCKHWQSRPVGVKEMREFFGVMASHQLQRGTYATTSKYTADAQAFAKANGINALDGTGLLKLIAARTPQQQQALLSVAFEGDYGRPTCASCGDKMLERTPSKGGARFWGCSNYPRCKSRLPMAAALR